MSASFVNSANNFNTAGGVLSVSYSPTVGNTLLVAVMSNTTTTTVSDGSNTYSKLGATAELGGFALSLLSAQVTTGDTLTIAASGTTVFGIYVAEYSGLSATPFISGSFESGAQGGPGIGANNITTTANPDVSSVPALLWGFSVNSNNAVG